MKKSLLVILISITTGLVSLIFAQTDNSDLKKTIDEMNQKYEKAMLDQNNDLMLSFYADDAISLPSYSTMMIGKDAIKKGMDMSKDANFKLTKFKLTNTNIITSGNLVCDIGTYEMTMEMQGMENPSEDAGKYMTIYEKQSDGSLKIKAEMWNTDSNPWNKGN